MIRGQQATPSAPWEEGSGIDGWLPKKVNGLEGVKLFILLLFMQTEQRVYSVFTACVCVQRYN